MKHRSRGQRGQGLVEFLIVLPVLMFLMMGIIQFALLYQVKAVLNHATFLAARSGALNNGRKGGIDPLGGGLNQGLAAGLAPLFNHGTSLADLTRARATAFTEVVNPLITNIDIISPTSQMVSDFGVRRLDNVAGREIPNDTLQYRSTAVGTSSRVSIQDANLLKIEVTYCARMIVPIANRALYSLFNGVSNFWNPGDEVGNVPSARCLIFNGDNTYRIPIKATYVIRMETPFRLN